MGLFKKIREADKAVDRFVDGMIGNAINKVSDFANARAYTLDLKTNNELVGKIEFVTSNLDYTRARIDSYLSSGVPLRGSVEEALA